MIVYFLAMNSKRCNEINVGKPAVLGHCYRLIPAHDRKGLSNAEM